MRPRPGAPPHHHALLLPLILALQMEYLSSLNVDVNKERQQQILADILVWAEVTQEHYDAMTRRWGPTGGRLVIACVRLKYSC